MNHPTYRVVSICVLFPLICSCAAKPFHSNFDYFGMSNTAPIIQTYNDPDFDLRKSKSVAVIPDDSCPNRLLAKQEAAWLSRQFEVHGFQTVKPDMNPDLIAKIHVATEYREHYIPAEQISVPEYVPGQKINVNLVTSPQYSYGLDDEVTKGTIETQGSIQYHTETVPGRTVGYYYPSTVISVFDSKTGTNTWMGTAVGVSTQADVRVSSQLLALRLCNQIGVADNHLPYFDSLPAGRTGMNDSYLTFDGNHYLPVVTNVMHGSPAEMAGMEYGDIIVSIDGLSTSDRSERWFLSALRGTPGTNVQLDVARRESVSKLNFWHDRSFNFNYYEAEDRRVNIAITRRVYDPIKKEWN